MKKYLVGIIGVVVACSVVACGSVDEGQIFSEDDVQVAAAVEGESPYSYACGVHWAPLWECLNSAQCNIWWKNYYGGWCNSATTQRQHCWNWHGGCQSGTWWSVWGSGRYTCPAYPTATCACACVHA